MFINIYDHDDEIAAAAPVKFALQVVARFNYIVYFIYAAKRAHTYKYMQLANYLYIHESDSVGQICIASHSFAIQFESGALCADLHRLATLETIGHKSTSSGGARKKLTARITIGRLCAVLISSISGLPMQFGGARAKKATQSAISLELASWRQ